MLKHLTKLAIKFHYSKIAGNIAKMDEINDKAYNLLVFRYGISKHWPPFGTIPEIDFYENNFR